MAGHGPGVRRCRRAHAGCGRMTSVQIVGLRATSRFVRANRARTSAVAPSVRAVTSTFETLPSTAGWCGAQHRCGRRADPARGARCTGLRPDAGPVPCGVRWPTRAGAFFGGAQTRPRGEMITSSAPERSHFQSILPTATPRFRTRTTRVRDRETFRDLVGCCSSGQEPTGVPEEFRQDIEFRQFSDQPRHERQHHETR